MGYEKANAILKPMPLLERLEALQNAPESRTPYEHWIRVSKAQLMQWYMNALVTYYSSGGHSKASRNDQSARAYLELMKKYNIPQPPNEIAFILGVFNGEGSC